MTPPLDPRSTYPHSIGAPALHDNPRWRAWRRAKPKDPETTTAFVLWMQRQKQAFAENYPHCIRDGAIDDHEAWDRWLGVTS